MIKKLFTFEDSFSITKAAGIVGFFTLVTKFVAIYRERLFSSTFGQGPLLDSYFSAFRIPDFVTNLLVLSTLSVAFLPVYSKLTAKNAEEANVMTHTVITTATFIIGGICLVLLLLSSPLMHLLVPGFSGQQFSETLSLTRLFLISPVLFTLSTVFGGVLNANKKFLVTSLAPILYNAGIILGVLYFYPRFGIMGLGYGVIVGALLQLAIQVFFVYKQGARFLPNLNIQSEAIKNLWRLYVPRIFAFDLSNITLLLGTVIGSVAASGSITALNQAFNLQSVPVGIFGYSIAVAAFPALSERFAAEDYEGFRRTLYNSITKTLLFIIPISILTLIFRAYVVRIILGAGAFTWEDTIRTFQLLGVFSFSFFSQCLTTLLSRAFFARHNTKIPVLVNIGALALNTILAFLLGRTMGVLGLTIAFVAASITNGALLFILLRRDMREHDTEKQETLFFDKSLSEFVTKCILASALFGLVSYAGLKAFAPLVNTETAIGIIIQCALSLAAGALVYGFSCIRLGLIPSLKQLWIFSRT